MARSSPRKPFTSDYFILEVLFPLQSFSEYITIVNELLNQGVEKALIQFKASEANINADIAKAKAYGLEGELWNEFVFGLIDQPAQDEYHIKNYYNTIYYSSILISVYSFFEKKLRYFCKTYEKDQTKRLSKRSKLDELINYIKKTLNINLELVDPQFKEFENFRELRNLVVHNELILHKQDDSVAIGKIKELDGIELVEMEGESLRLHFKHSGFLNDLIKIVRQILDEVYNVRATH